MQISFSILNSPFLKKSAFACCFQSVKSIILIFHASCGSTIKNKFAKQIHKFKGMYLGIYTREEKCARRARFSSVFARKRGFEREDARKTIVFRPASKTLRLFFQVSCSLHHSFSVSRSGAPAWNKGFRNPVHWAAADTILAHLSCSLAATAGLRQATRRLPSRRPGADSGFRDFLLHSIASHSFA